MKTIDDKMAEIADQIPGFAGYYLEPTDPELLKIDITDFEMAKMIADNMRPIVRMTNSASLPASTFTKLRHALSEFHDIDSVMENNNSEFIIRPAKYNFRQLQDWLRSIKDYNGLISLRIDELNNRIEVGVEEQKYLVSLQTALSQLGIPEDAFSVILDEPVQLANSLSANSSLLFSPNSLRNTYRPVIGGLEIRNSFGSGCTLGFIAKSGGITYFVTNSHCSEEPWVIDSGIMYQVSPLSIGFEVNDPPTFNCPYGSKCRFSDASIYQLYSGVSYDNHIAFPDTQGSLVFDETKNVISNSLPSTHSLVFKVGRTTGAQAGVVWDTCESRKGDDGVWRMCNIESSLDTAGGDSGSPIFNFPNNDINSPNVRLHGIHWGSNSNKAYASRIDLIQAELNLALTTSF